VSSRELSLGKTEMLARRLSRQQRILNSNGGQLFDVWSSFKGTPEKGGGGGEKGGKGERGGSKRLLTSEFLQVLREKTTNGKGTR